MLTSGESSRPIWLLHLSYSEALKAIEEYSRPLTLHFIPRAASHGAVSPNWHHVGFLKPQESIRLQAKSGQRFAAVELKPKLGAFSGKSLIPEESVQLTAHAAITLFEPA